MEDLRIAINAMKAAEVALASRGYTLRWKVRVKADQGFLRRMVDRLTKNAEAPALKPEQFPEAAPENRGKPSGQCRKAAGAKAPRKASKPMEKARAEISPEQQPQEEAQPAEQKPEDTVEEVRPVTALDTTLAADYLGMSYNGLYDLVKRKRIPAHGKVGARWFLTEELDQYLESKKSRLAGK
jgi:predicted DNA-binding transcriptional regulator AlpA